MTSKARITKDFDFSIYEWINSNALLSRFDASCPLRAIKIFSYTQTHIAIHIIPINCGSDVLQFNSCMQSSTPYHPHDSEKISRLTFGTDEERNSKQSKQNSINVKKEENGEHFNPKIQNMLRFNSFFVSTSISPKMSWEMKFWRRKFEKKKTDRSEYYKVEHLHFSFSSGSCNAGVFDRLWWWWWWFDVSCDKWFKLLLPDDMRPVMADDTLTADDTESCKLWWLCKWSFDVPLFVPADTKSCRHRPCASLIFCIPRSMFMFFVFVLMNQFPLFSWPNFRESLCGREKMQNIKTLKNANIYIWAMNIYCTIIIVSFFFTWDCRIVFDTQQKSG